MNATDPVCHPIDLEPVLTAAMRAAQLAALKVGSQSPDDAAVQAAWANDPARTLCNLLGRIKRDLAKL